MLNEALPGKRVLVPFGRQRVTGYILGPAEQQEEEKIKDILDILDTTPVFPGSMINFFRWISNYYIYPPGLVIKAALPGGLNSYHVSYFKITKKGKEMLDAGLLTGAELKILACLKKRSFSLNDICKKLKISVPRALVNSMTGSGLIERKQELKQGRTRAVFGRHVCLIKQDIDSEKLSCLQKKVFNALKDKGRLSVKELNSMVPGGSRSIKTMEKRGIVSIDMQRVYRDPFGDFVIPDKSPVLTEEQELVISTVKNSFGKGFFAYLLAGVTGSGKTEVYMQLAEAAVQINRRVLVLVPEIALISQTERRFRARFGDRIALIHSNLSPGEQYDQWTRIMDKEASIVIGARSAVFAPLTDIGIIIVDEEHDSSYKQEGQLHYNARDLAVVRAKLDRTVVLLGSATPSLQSYHNTITKKFTEVKLTKRVNEQQMPVISIVDLRKIADKRGTGRFISTELYTAIQETLAHGNQVMLFLNRRGFATHPICVKCGKPVECKNCDISLTFHKSINAYRCHYCGFTQSAYHECSICGSMDIKLLGPGTEKLENVIKGFFPDARVARMDSDTIARKGSVLKILKALKEQRIDILVGTQIIAKGHDFPNVTLVGIICADLSLNFPDFRAGERTFQLLAQVAGRSGRGRVPGKVILQTFNPEHFTILSAKNHDFKAFYKVEISLRKALTYPPFSRIILLKISGKDKEKTRNQAQTTGDVCNRIKSESGHFQSIQIMGPAEAAITRVAKQYRWQILLKSVNTPVLQQFIRKLLFENKSVMLNNKNVRLVVDVDPFFMM